MTDRSLTLLNDIKLLILDVDGVLSDGQLYFSNNGEEIKAFHAKDGLGIHMLRNNGVEVALITGRKSTIVARRARELGIELVYQGRLNKLAAYEDCISKLGLEPHQVAYMGDDIIDVPVMKRVGFGFAPADAMSHAIDVADVVTKRLGGHGAVREVCELILHQQNKWQQAIEKYGN